MMGNLTSPKFPEDDIPGGGVLHPDGLILGGLNQAETPGSLDLLIDRHPADIDTAPYTISGDTSPPIAMPAFGQPVELHAPIDGSYRDLVLPNGRTVGDTVSEQRFQPLRGARRKGPDDKSGAFGLDDSALSVRQRGLSSK